MNLDTALTNINTLTQPQAAALKIALAARLKLLRDQDNARISALVTVGCTVKISEDGRPKRRCGLIGVVRSTDGKYADLMLDEPSTAKHGQQLLDRIPLTVLEVLDPAQAFVDIVDFLNQASTEDLETLNDARRRRFEALTAALTVGAQVTVTNISPKFFAGLVGEIESLDKADRTCTVLLDEASTGHLRRRRYPKYTPAADVKRYSLPLLFTQVLVTDRS